MLFCTCVDDGLLLESSSCSLDEERHEAELDAVLLLEVSLESVSDFHGSTHVDFLEGGQQRVGVLRIFKTFSDSLTHSRQGFTSFSSVLFTPFYLD